MTDWVCCPECGCVNEQATQTIANLERDLRVKRAAISRLEGERAESTKKDSHFIAAMEVLEYWRTKVAPQTRELNGQRLTNCLARLRGGYSVDHLKMAVDGYATLPYVHDRQRCAEGRPTERKVDAEMIFRDPTFVDRGLAMLADKEPLSISRLPEHLRRLAQGTLV